MSLNEMFQGVDVNVVCVTQSQLLTLQRHKKTQREMRKVCVEKKIVCSVFYVKLGK